MIRRRRLTDLERADRAEAKAFRPGLNRSGFAQNRKSQLVFVLGLGATFVGGSLMLAGSLIGIAIFVVGLPVTVATGVWCFRNWDW